MQSFTKTQLQIAVNVCIGQILVGFSLGWSAPVLVKLQDADETPLEKPITDTQASLLASMLYLGCIVGPHVTVYLSNTKGRKICLILGGILSSLAFILHSIALNFAFILTGRVLMGISTGIMFVISFVYIGEIATTSIRGILLSGIGIAGTLGTLVVYSIGPYVSFSVISYVGLAISALFTVGLLLVPESPMFFVLNDDYATASTLLTKLGREDEIPNLRKMEDEIRKTRTQDWKEMITIKSNRKALFITVTLCILQQMSGVLVVMFFATTIFTMAGSSIAPPIATIIIGLTQLAASSVTPLVVDRAGRKILLIGSCAISALSLAALGTYFYFYENGFDVNNVQWLPLVTLVIFFLFYDLGFGIIPGTIMGEMFDPNVRVVGSTVTITTGWLVGFGVSLAFDSMISGLRGSGTFWFFSGSCAMALVFTVLYVPETKMKSLVEIQEMLNK